MSEKSGVKENEKGGTEAAGNTRFSKKMIAGFLVMQLAISILTIGVYDRYFAQKIVVLDVNRYIASLKADYVAGKINNEALDQAPKKIQRAVEAVGSNTTILVGEAVLKNGKYLKIEN
jgi:hypothetical protein